jgi:DNA-binding NarL/FixJ family response regulator
MSELSPHVGVNHVSRGFRLGVVRELAAAGLMAVEVDRGEIPGWLAETPAAALLVSVDGSADYEWLHDLLTDAPRAAAIALVSPLSIWNAGCALDAGASGVLDRDGDPARWADVVTQTRRGVVTFLPDELAVLVGAEHHARPALTGEDVELLRAVVANEPMEKIAAQFGHSVRTMHRRLNSLYSRMGARDRAEAVRTALAWGLAEIDPHTSPVQPR